MNSLTKHFRNLKGSLRRRARLRGVPCTITRTELRRLFENCMQCEICQVEFDAKPNQPAHPSIERIIPSLGYIIENVTIICRNCNSTKGELDALGVFLDAKDPYKRKILEWAQTAALRVKAKLLYETT